MTFAHNGLKFSGGFPHRSVILPKIETSVDAN